MQNPFQFGSPEFSAALALFAAVIAAVSAGIALLSVFMTRKNWSDSNRPVVSIYVDEKSSGPGITVFELLVTNTGARPALSVQLTAKPSDVDRLIADGADEKRRKQTREVFGAESRLTVLKPSETLMTSFGLATQNPGQQWLNYGIEIPVIVRYSDTEGKRWRTKTSLRTRPRQGFGGGVWRDPKDAGG